MDATFTISSSHDSFSQKQKNLFDQLNLAEKEVKPVSQAVEHVERLVNNPTSQRNTTKHFRNQESIFKRPEAPIERCLPRGRLAEFQKNPQKWIKYSLEDVEDMSEKSNKVAALSFLKDMEKRQSDEEIKADGLPTKITYTKKVMIHDEPEISEAENKSSFRSSKVIMPEYIVGQKTKRERKQSDKSQKTTNAKQLKLSHLEEEDDIT